MLPKIRNSFFTLVLIFLVFHSASVPEANSALSPEAMQESGVWEVPLTANAQAKSNITVSNHCKNAQSFTVTLQGLPYLRFLAGSTVTVPGQGRQDVPVMFDATGLRPGEYRGTVVIKCNTCSHERGCVQDRQTIPVHVTVNEPATLSVRQTSAPSVAPRPIQTIVDTDLPAPPKPEIALISPPMGSLVRESHPTFRWKVSGVPVEMQRVFYRLKIVEVQQEQNLEEAILRNPPVFERSNLTEESFRLSERGAELASGKIYAWQVTAFDPRGAEVSRSSISFIGINSWPAWSICWLFPYGPQPIKYCIGQNLAVAFALYLSSGGGPFSWTLTPTGSTTGSTQSGSSTSATITIPASQLPSAPGTYTYTLTVTRGSCSRSAPITIAAYPPGAVGGTAVVTMANNSPVVTSPAQICDGQTAVLDVQGETGLVGQWEYSDNGGPWLNATSAFNIAGAPANTNQMHPSGCTAPHWYTDRSFRAVVSTSNDPNAPSCSTTYSAPTTLRIYCKPQVGTVTASTTHFCAYTAPTSITLTMSGTVIGDFDWFANGSLIPGSHNQLSLSVPAPASTTTYSVTVTTNGPCPSVSSSVTVIVDTQPFCASANTALTLSPTAPVCPGDAAVLTLSNCSGIVTWQQGQSPNGPWTTISTGNSVQNTTDLFQTTYWRAVINPPPGSVCPAITSNVVVVNVKPAPAAPVVATPSPICFGANATLTASPSPPTGVSYNWYHDDILIPCGNGASCTFPAEPGNYWVEADNGCETVQSNIVTLPVEIITVQIHAPCCGAGGPVTLTALASSSLSGTITNPALFTWYQGTTQVGTGVSITVNPQSTTQYCVRVSSPTVPNCSAQSCTTITVCP